MPVKTRWPITDARGHTAARVLSAQNADERAGFSKWPTSKECTECWRAKQGASQRLSAEDWLARKRPRSAPKRRSRNQRAELRLLAGSEQAGDSGRRFAMRSAAYEAVVMNGDLATGAAGELERTARRIDRASWWVDIRDHEPSGVRELVEAAQATRAVSSENDF